ncbi:glycosyltransferase [candidate division KSB1 bacterium]|nr:glycosyltransferase [candidate division KSB1 bacterium]
MKLLFVNSAWPASWGGGEKWTIEAARWFSAQGESVHVVGWPGSRLVSQAREFGLDAVEFRFRGDFDPRARMAAARLLTALTPDLIVVNFNKEVWTFGSAARRRGIPVVARHGFPLLRNTWHHRYAFARHISRLIVNADSIRDDYRGLGLDVSTVRVIHNGVRPVEQQRGALRRQLGVGTDDILIASAGRIETQKRFDLFIELASMLCATHSHLRFVLFGQGPLETELRRRVASMGLSAMFNFFGFAADYAALIGDADLFVLTSENEGTPNALLEAMVAGVASVSFDVGAVSRMFRGELRENLIPAGDLSALRGRVERLLVNPDARRACAAAMQARARSEFDLDSSMREFQAVFAETLRRR